MKKRGRPSKEIEDREKLVEMAERWCAGAAGLSVRRIARITVGLEAASKTSTPRYSLKDDAAMTPKPSSTAKRLERRFNDLVATGAAIGISVYRVLMQERAIADSTFRQFEKSPVKETAVRCGIAESDVAEKAAAGLKILSDWFPREYAHREI